jgi:hypothetical protein
MRDNGLSLLRGSGCLVYTYALVGSSPRVRM